MSAPLNPAPSVIIPFTSSLRVDVELERGFGPMQEEDGEHSSDHPQKFQRWRRRWATGSDLGSVFHLVLALRIRIWVRRRGDGRGGISGGIFLKESR